MISLAGIAAWVGLSKLRLVLFGIAVAGILSLAGGLYLKGRIDQSHANEVATLKEANAMLNKGLKAEKQAGAQMAKRLAEYDENSTGFTTYVEKLERNGNGKDKGPVECFSADDVDQLRTLWR